VGFLKIGELGLGFPSPSPRISVLGKGLRGAIGNWETE